MRQKIPHSNAEVVAHCAKTGLPVADALCHTVTGLDCAYASATPKFDATTGELSLCGDVLLQLSGKAENQIRILQAFQVAGWPHRIENPFRQHMPWDRATRAERRCVRAE